MAVGYMQEVSKEDEMRIEFGMMLADNESHMVASQLTLALLTPHSAPAPIQQADNSFLTNHITH